MVQIVNSCGQPDNHRAFEVYKRLAEKEGVVVRFRGNEIGCEGCLRVTVGSVEENKVLIDRFTMLLAVTAE